MSPRPMLSGSRRSRCPSGLSPADVVVTLCVVVVVILFLIMAATRSRESARLAMCQRNLAQIGQALTLYDGSFVGLPFVGTPVAPGSPLEPAPPSPQKAMLHGLGVATFLGLDVEKGGRPGSAEPLADGIPVAGFVCPADMGVFSGKFATPSTYRASVGSDLRGTDGPFAIGRPMKLAEVERRDGLAFTAAFSERVVGDGLDAKARANYAVRDDVAAAGSESGTTGRGFWRGDAGSRWAPADFRYTLYTHAENPGREPSLVAADGRESNMGASSSHVQGVNLLMLDGSARVVSPSIAPELWRAYGSIGPEPDKSPAENPPRN